MLSQDQGAGVVSSPHAPTILSKPSKCTELGRGHILGQNAFCAATHGEASVMTQSPSANDNFSFFTTLII